MDGLGQKTVDEAGQPVFSGAAGEVGFWLGDEDAEAGAGVEDAIAFELGVDAGDGVGIDDELTGQITDAGEALVGLETPAGDGFADLGDELAVDGGAAGWFDAEFHGHLLY